MGTVLLRGRQDAGTFIPPYPLFSILLLSVSAQVIRLLHGRERSISLRSDAGVRFPGRPLEVSRAVPADVGVGCLGLFLQPAAPRDRAGPADNSSLGTRG